MQCHILGRQIHEQRFRLHNHPSGPSREKVHFVGLTHAAAMQITTEEERIPVHPSNAHSVNMRETILAGSISQRFERTFQLNLRYRHGA